MGMGEQVVVAETLVGIPASVRVWADGTLEVTAYLEEAYDACDLDGAPLSDDQVEAIKAACDRVRNAVSVTV